MYESPHPPHAVTTGEATTHALDINWGSIDWTIGTMLIAAVAIVAFITLNGRNRRRVGGAAGDFNGATDAANLSDSSWGPGHHSSSGSDAGHHGGFFDGGSSDAGGGGHH